MGAAVVVGTTQRFGIPMGYGGPHAGYFATKKNSNVRCQEESSVFLSMLTETVPLRMALGTREQHIKREKATSNICTSSSFISGYGGMYAVYHGPKVYNILLIKFMLLQLLLPML